jgi:outer membrane protein TolC
MQWSANAQTLTLEQAIQLALKNNYDIKIAKNNLKIDERNNTIGNAGMLPIVNANINNNNTLNTINLTQANGEERELEGVRNLNLNYGVGLDWTIFDGFRMFARKEQLKTLEEQGKAELKFAILTKVGDVYATYFDLVQQQLQIAALDTAIVVSKERLKTAENRYSIGKSSKLEMLNAKVDLNTDISIQLKQQELLKQTKIKLNEILARNLDIEFQVTNAITIDEQLNFEELQTNIENQNPQLQAQVLAKRVAELQLKQTKANRYPNVQINTSYNFTRSESPFGFITQSYGRGFVYGFTASVPVFNGFNQNRNEKVAQLEVENAQFLLEQQKMNISAQLNSAYASFQTNLQLIKVEETNLEIARENLDITLAKFKIGTITTIEFRTAQQNYLDASVRYANAQYLAKLTEINLKELAGSLSLE